MNSKQPQPKPEGIERLTAPPPPPPQRFKRYAIEARKLEMMYENIGVLIKHWTKRSSEEEHKFNSCSSTIDQFVSDLEALLPADYKPEPNDGNS